MKTIGFSFLTLAALFFLSSTVLSQEGSQGGSVPKWVYGQPLPLGQPRLMTLAIAKQIIAAGQKAACTPTTCSAALAIVDDAGVLIDEETIDGTLADAPELAIRKAKTAALWRRTTDSFQEEVKSGRNIAYADGTFKDMTISPGGMPLFVNGRVVGGLGSAALGGREAAIFKAVVEETAKVMGK
jgi:uncharacterized protein GlcG (DUF336 family)